MSAAWKAHWLAGWADQGTGSHRTYPLRARPPLRRFVLIPGDDEDVPELVPVSRHRLDDDLIVIGAL